MNNEKFFESVKKTGDFALSSGVKSNILFDCSEFSPRDISNLSAALGVHHLRFNQPISLLGVAYGGITLAYEIGSIYHFPFAIYTKEGDIRGKLPTKGIVIVDDVITTGHSVLAAALAIDKTEGEHKVVAVISLIRRFDIDKRELPWPHFYLYGFGK